MPLSSSTCSSKKAGQDNAAALFGTHGKHFAEYTQRVGQNVGDNDIKLTLRQAVRQVELSVDVVLRGIAFTGADSLFVNIYTDGGACAEFEGGNGQKCLSRSRSPIRFRRL